MNETPTYLKNVAPLTYYSDAEDYLSSSTRSQILRGFKYIIVVLLPQIEYA